MSRFIVNTSILISCARIMLATSLASNCNAHMTARSITIYARQMTERSKAYFLCGMPLSSQ